MTGLLDVAESAASADLKDTSEQAEAPEATDNGKRSLKDDARNTPVGGVKDIDLATEKGRLLMGEEGRKTIHPKPGLLRHPECAAQISHPIIAPD